jgi:Fic family protein
MCDVVNENADWDPFESAAYLLWRLNWIHPFGGGNGRTSRAVSYQVFCARYGTLLPGSPTVPERIIRDRKLYEQGLRDADEANKAGVIDVSRLVSLWERWIEEQLSYLDD